MDGEFGDELAAKVVAMQFAGGRSIVELADEWERDAEWVEAAVRRELLKLIPERDGGLKASRASVQAERRLLRKVGEGAQGRLEW